MINLRIQTISLGYKYIEEVKEETRSYSINIEEEENGRGRDERT